MTDKTKKNPVGRPFSLVHCHDFAKLARACKDLVRGQKNGRGLFLEKVGATYYNLGRWIKENRVDPEVMENMLSFLEERTGNRDYIAYCNRLDNMKI